MERECHDGGCVRKVIFHDKQNPRGKAVTPDVYESAESAGGYLSEDGKYFVVEYNDWEKPDELVLFDVLARNPLSVKSFEDEMIEDIAVSAQGNFVAVGTRNAEKREYLLYLLNGQGDLLIREKLEYRANYYIAFSADERLLIAGSNKGYLYAFSVETRTLS